MKRSLAWIALVVCSFSMEMAASDGNFRFAYVANQSSNTVSVIDRATNAIVDTIGDIPGPGGVAVTHNGREVWVVAYNEVDVIDTATNSVTSRIPSSSTRSPSQNRQQQVEPASRQFLRNGRESSERRRPAPKL